MVFYLSERPMMDRHTAVSLPYNTETIDSPMEGVIRVNLFHFAGGTGKKPLPFCGRHRQKAEL